jgi:fructose-specific phosphotransferase system IIC component
MATINKHLIRGFSYAFPFIVLFSISLAISEAITDIRPIPDTIFLIVVPVLTVGIATSIVSKPAIVPAFILGYLVNDMGIGFLGGILTGLLLGYGLKWSIEYRLPTKQTLSKLMKYVVYPMVIGVVLYLVMYLLSIPIVVVLDTLESWIRTIEPSEIVILVGVLSFLTVVDLGGPMNKLAFTLVLEFYTSRAFAITGPALIAVSIPPISMLLATMLLPKRIETPDKTVRRLMIFGSLLGMTESAIPTIAGDVKRRLPIVVIGSVIASMFAAWMGLENVLLMTSVPGMFGVSNIGIYFLSYLLGIGVILGLLVIVSPKKPLQNTENPL